jgi:hypothetical protein
MVAAFALVAVALADDPALVSACAMLLSARAAST